MLVVASWIGAFAASSLAVQVPRFETRIEVVKVSVLVRGREGPILGLRAADFEVRDNGVAQQVEQVEQVVSEELPLSVMLAFDVSGSVRGEKLVELKRASHALVDGLRPEDRAALLTFRRAALASSVAGYGPKRAAGPHRLPRRRGRHVARGRHLLRSGAR